MNPSELQGQRVTVVGAARSGRAAARLLARHGARVLLTERGALEEDVRARLQEAGVAFEEGGHTDAALEADFLVVSPGVPTEAPLVQRALERGLPVYAEIEVAAWCCRAPIVAVTGSNGKTTTTKLVGHVFERAFVGTERRVIVAGNVGTAFSEVAERARPEDVVVLEVSSFQLDHVDGFRPRVAMLLNITPDHLDRYGGSVERYAQAKFRIFENQQDGDTLVYNYDDPRVRAAAEEAAAQQPFRALPFSLDAEPQGDGAFVQDDHVTLRLGGRTVRVVPAGSLALPGRHNRYNSLAAALAARVMEVESDALREALQGFEGVPHRLEQVRELDGVRYVNDSKATNVNAVWYALESMDRPVVLLAGGRDKGNDYEPLKELLREKGRAVVALGESAEKVLSELGPCAPEASHAVSMADAVQQARALARPGDVVLLSPACSSFDQFRDYEDRGDTFKRLVHELR